VGGFQGHLIRNKTHRPLLPSNRRIDYKRRVAINLLLLVRFIVHCLLLEGENKVASFVLVARHQNVVLDTIQSCPCHFALGITAIVIE